MVDEAVRYIRELETALANKVKSYGGQLPPELEMLQQNTNQEFPLSPENRSDQHPLNHVYESSTAQSNNPCMNSVDRSIQLRNLISQFIITSQRTYNHDCTEILHGLHKATISDTVVDRE